LLKLLREEMLCLLLPHLISPMPCAFCCFLAGFLTGIIVAVIIVALWFYWALTS
jgi:hypothetical protein